MADSAPGSLPLDKLTRLCTSREMGRWDDQAIRSRGLPGRLLMENAANALVNALLQWRAELDVGGPVVLCCGKGNNGGDGYAAARLLRNRGLEVTVAALGKPGGDDALFNRLAWEKIGKTLDFNDSAAEVAERLGSAGVIVDALFGTGLARPLAGPAAELARLINASPAPIKVAVDIPSGVDSDTGRVLGEAVTCTHTVTFQLGKVGCFQYPGAQHAGELLIAPISIPTPWEPDDPATYLLDAPFVSALLPARPPAGHKGSFGHLLTLCGSAGMGGAALLAGLAALKSGAGLVTSGVPISLRDGFLGAAPELMTLASAGDSAGDGDSDGDSAGGSGLALEGEHAEFFLEAAHSRDAVVLGCGLGSREGSRTFVERIAAGLERPLLIDADGLNLLEPETLKARSHPAVITPHPGELSRLARLDKQELAADRVGHARRLAAQWGVTLVLKGANTVVAAPTGEVFINPTGDQGLATAGTGDVLAGMVGGLLAQGLTPPAAAVTGVYWHGLARDLQAGEIADVCFTATDLLGGMSEALLAIRKAGG